MCVCACVLIKLGELKIYECCSGWVVASKSLWNIMSELVGWFVSGREREGRLSFKIESVR